MLDKILNKVGNKKPESKMAGLAAAATTGITVARFLGKKSIYGALVGVGVTLLAKKLMKNKQQEPHIPLETPPEKRF